MDELRFVKMRVLLVEDELITRRLVRKMIAELGFEVKMCNDAEEAWSEFLSDSYQILVTDWMLPGMSGLDLCRKIRSSGKDLLTTIIVMTALTEPSHIDEVLSAGADDYISKPIDRSHFGVRLKIAKRRVELLISKVIYEQLDKLSSLFQDSTVGIMVSNSITNFSEMQVLYANDTLLRLINSTEDDQINVHLTTFVEQQRVRAQIEQHLNSAMKGSNETIELEINREGSELRNLLWSVNPIKDATGELCYFAHVICEMNNLTQRGL